MICAENIQVGDRFANLGIVINIDDLHFGRYFYFKNMVDPIYVPLKHLVYLTDHDF